MILNRQIRTIAPLLAALVAAVLPIQPSFADYPKPDTTKATVLDDLCVLGVNGAVCTSDYLFNTVVTNGMYDTSETNRNCWTRNQYMAQG